MGSANAKKLAAENAASLVHNGMTVGLGTGTTAYWAIKKIGERIADEGLQIKAVATSLQSEKLALECNIEIIPFAEVDVIDITIDGADEADPALNLIKGGGGALLREKIIATNSKQMVVVADASKLVKHLGKFPLPVEVVPFAYELTIKKIAALKCLPVMRMNGKEAYITDNGNYIFDCEFKEIQQPKILHDEINAIPGVVENGLFINIAAMLIAAYEDGKIVTIHPQ